MASFIRELQKITSDLQKQKVAWALVGGLAISIHSEPRTTKDVDLVVALENPEKLDDLANALLQTGYFNKQILMHVNPTHRLGIRVSIESQSGYLIPVDLLDKTCGIEKEIVLHATNIEILPSVMVPVACLGHILAMKILAQNDTDRIQDKADAIALIKAASDDDVKTARDSCVLIGERGFNRGKDLLAELNLLLGNR